MQAVTFVAIALVGIFTRGMARRLLILAGLIAATAIYAAAGQQALDAGKPIDATRLARGHRGSVFPLHHPLFESRGDSR